MGSLKDLPCVYKVKGNDGSQMPYSHFILFFFFLVAIRCILFLIVSKKDWTFEGGWGQCFTLVVEQPGEGKKSPRDTNHRQETW